MPSQLDPSASSADVTFRRETHDTAVRLLEEVTAKAYYLEMRHRRQVHRSEGAYIDGSLFPFVTDLYNIVVNHPLTLLDGDDGDDLKGMLEFINAIYARINM